MEDALCGSIWWAAAAEEEEEEEEVKLKVTRGQLRSKLESYFKKLS